MKYVTVYCGSYTPNDECFVYATQELARFMALHGMTLVYGGSNCGIMKVLSDTMLQNGGEVIGIFTENLSRELLHPNLTQSIIVKNLAQRKAEMIKRADCIIALPGSFGTLDELFDALALKKIRKNGHDKPIGILNVNGYFDYLLKFIQHSVECGFTNPKQSQILKVATTVPELFKQLEKTI